MGQDAASKSAAVINTGRCVQGGKKRFGFGTNEPLDDKDLVSNQISVDKIQRQDFKFTTLLRGQFIHGGEIFSTRTIELRTK